MSEQELKQPSYTLAFRVATVIAISIALYHAVAFFYPAIGKIAYGTAYLPGYPVRRHLFWAVTFTILAGFDDIVYLK